MNIAFEIKKLIKGEVVDDEETLLHYSRDASIFVMKPQVIVFPKDVDDIKKLVSWVRENHKSIPNLSLTPRAAGTDMTGGPLSNSIVVECTTHFNHIKEINTDSARVEPGVYYRDFDAAMRAKNLYLPSYPASRELCTIGGMVANNAGGEKTLRYGKTARYVKEIKMILGDGNEYAFHPLSFDQLEAKKQEPTFEGLLYKKMHQLIAYHYDLIQSAKPTVTKNSSGYALWDVINSEKRTFDLSKVITGSQGTLGIITEMTIGLVKPKPHSRLLVIFLNDLAPLANIAQIVLPHDPESFESFDDNTFRLAIKFFPEIIERLKGNVLRMILGFLPEAWMVLRGGIPKLVLLVEFAEDTVEAAEQKAEAVKQAIRQRHQVKMRITKSDEETEQYWIIRRESFNLLRKHIHGKRTTPFIDDFVVEPTKLLEFLPKLYAILKNYKLPYTIAGHVGDGNFHIIPLMDLSNPKSAEIIKKLSQEVYNLVIAYHGSITGEHNDGLIRAPFLKQAFGAEVYRLFSETQYIFDPEQIFNPGKKVDVSLTDALKYLDTKMD